MRITVGMKSAAEGKPLQAGVHRLKTIQMKENTFDSGSWGFEGRHKVIASDVPGAMNKLDFENYVCLDPDGNVSGAIFRFGGLYMATHGEDAEIDAETVDEAKEQFRTLAESCMNQEFSAETDIQPATEEGYRDQSKIEKFL